MKYITHHKFDRLTMASKHLIIDVGEVLERVGDILYYNGEPVCVHRSLVGKQHFAVHDDGQGLERGALTHQLAYAPRLRRGGVTGDVQQRFTDGELETLSTQWSQYLKPDIDMVLFNDKFFEEDPSVLKQIAESVHIDISKGGD